MFETKRLGYLASLASLRPSGQRFRRFMYSPLCGIESGVSFGQYIHNVRMNGSAGASILHGNCHGNCAGRSNSTAGPNVADRRQRPATADAVGPPATSVETPAMTVPDAAVVATANAVTAASHNSTTADDRAAAHNRTAAEDRPASIATTANHYAATIQRRAAQRTPERPWHDHAPRAD